MDNKAAIGKSLEIANSDNKYTYEAAGYYLPQKRTPFFSKTHARNKRYQCKLVCTGPMNKWCNILTIKTLTKVNRTSRKLL